MKFDEEEPDDPVEELAAQVPRSPWSAVKTAKAAHAEFGQLPDDTTDPAALAARVPRQIW